VLSYLLAVLAACANATSSVLQRKANREVPRKQNLSPRLIWSLAHQPTWFGGVLAIFVGFLLQATALGNGQLSVVPADSACCQPDRAGDASTPKARARSTASVRLWASSFWYRCRTCVLTVFADKLSSSAISLAPRWVGR
jgi:hypothetical protein